MLTPYLDVDSSGNTLQKKIRNGQLAQCKQPPPS